MSLVICSFVDSRTRFTSHSLFPYFDVEQGGVIVEPGEGALELKETLAHVLV